VSTTTTEPILLSVEGVASALGISKRTVWRLTSTGAGGFPKPIRIGRAVRWSRESLIEWASKWEGVEIPTGEEGRGRP